MQTASAAVGARPVVGVLLNNGGQFVNGSEQQPYFVVEVLKALGVEYRLYSHDGSERSGLKRTDTFYGEPMQRLIASDLSDVTVFIMICHIVDDGSESTTLLRRRLEHCRVVQFHCGNHAYFNAEDVVFGRHNVVRLLYNQWISETWVFDMHKFAKHYYEHLTQRPCRVMPYMWSPALIDRYVVEKDLAPFCAPAAYEGAPLTLCCFEPNLNVTKTCLVPLLIMNSYYLRARSRVFKCFIFCASEVAKRPQMRDFLRFLDIAREGKIEIYPRMIFPEVMHSMREKRLCPVIVGHQVANAQNYLMLEALHLDCPVVHNCEWMQTAGLYYAGWNVTAAVEKLAALDDVYVRKHDVYRRRSAAVLESVSPRNFSIVADVKKLLTSAAPPMPLPPPPPKDRPEPQGGAPSKAKDDVLWQPLTPHADGRSATADAPLALGGDRCCARAA